jgi:phosphonate transport system permease protein
MNRPRRRPQTPQKPPLVAPPVAALLSLVLPGLGQMLSRQFRRGFTLLITFVSIVGLLIWRFNVSVQRAEGLVPILRKALRLEPTLIVISIGVVILYIWVMIDAFFTARGQAQNAAALFILVAIIFFGLGWQIGEIEPLQLVQGLEEGGAKLEQVMWPWQRAISRHEELIEASADIQVPCTDNPPAPNRPQLDEPYLIAEPTCGSLSEQNGAPGTTLSLEGGNFAPDASTKLVWEDPIGNEFRQRQGGEFISPVTDDEGDFNVEIIMPYRLLPPSVSEEAQIWTIHAQQVAGVGPPEPSRELRLAVERMIETIFLGMMATFFGIILAIPISFLAARNLMSASILTMGIYFITRTILNIVRSIEPLIWTVIAVVVVGLGPFPGILALSLHTIAALGKLYSESIESIDPGPIEAIQATGANWVQTVIYAVIPQIVPPFVSFTIYRWDINVRMSTVIGLVGGGGIGFLLIQWIRLLDYRAAGIAVWFIAITVAVLDYVSSEIRRRFV